MYLIVFEYFCYVRKGELTKADYAAYNNGANIFDITDNHYVKRLFASGHQDEWKWGYIDEH